MSGALGAKSGRVHAGYTLAWGKNGEASPGQVEIRYQADDCLMIFGMSPDHAEAVADQLRKDAAKVREHDAKRGAAS